MIFAHPVEILLNFFSAIKQIMRQSFIHSKYYIANSQLHLYTQVKCAMMARAKISHHT